MKRGQLQISFGMIFSILIIIFTIAVAFYFISNFIRYERCVDTGLFFKDLEEEINKAWESPISDKIFQGNINKEIESICFGNLSKLNSNLYKEEIKNLQFSKRDRANVFIYPKEKACGNSLKNYYIKNAQVPTAFCQKNENGKIIIRIKKEFEDALVKIEKNG